jgi:16S rRNA (cytosine1402-N4)-methyltransferase
VEIHTHLPVLLDEVMAFLQLQPGGTYLDCTFGRGGHAREILRRLGPDGRLIALDRDLDAAQASAELCLDPRFSFTQIQFSLSRSVLEAQGVWGHLDGVLLDFGVSSPQLNVSERGFSFQSDGPLDMRMDQTSGQTAAQWLALAAQADIERCLFTFGEERHGRRIARRICAEREREPIQTTAQLAAIVAAAVPRSGERIHPATRAFQALRIQVNDELGEIERGLSLLRGALAPGGRLCAISFHSLEDRIVKRYFRDSARPAQDAFGVERAFHLVTRKPTYPSPEEARANPRARSARLRVLERAS